MAHGRRVRDLDGNDVVRMVVVSEVETSQSCYCALADNGSALI